MRSIDEILPLLSPLLDGMAKHFGDNCEFVVHDYTRDFSSTIVAIANGQVTGREVGQGGSKLGLRIMQGKEEEDGKYNYISQTSDGRFLRSSTIYLKGEDGTILGSLCINIDVSEFIRSRNFMDRMIGADLPQTQQKAEELVLFENVEELLVALVRKAKSRMAEAMSLEGSLDELPCDPKEYQERLRRFKALTRQHTQLTRNIRDLTAGRQL